MSALYLPVFELAILHILMKNVIFLKEINGQEKKTFHTILQHEN